MVNPKPVTINPAGQPRVTHAKGEPDLYTREQFIADLKKPPPSGK